MPSKLVADAMLDNLSSMMVVTRSFTGAGSLLHRGEVVDTNGWRNVPSLRDNRYLAHLPHGTGSGFVTIELDGRICEFVSQEMADAATTSQEAHKAAQARLSASYDEVVPTGPFDLENAAAAPTAALEADPDTTSVRREVPRGSKGSK